jgi:hypothetical protein
MSTETAGTTGEQYKLNQAYKQAFGHVRAPFPVLLAQTDSIGLSPVGTFKALKGTFSLRSKLNTDYTLPTKLDGWQIPQEPTIGIRGSKNIIETQLNRGDRTKNVLEEINLNNYQVKIRGIILNEEDFDAYPDEAVRRLREICEKAGSISIENGLTTIWNITKVAIRDFDLFEVKGYLGAQAFEIDCISDEDFELELVNEPERI